jgi:GH24 family phage-related lysozyme (muramidase)
MKNELLAKLNSKYANSEITRLANAGDWAGAQNAAAGVMWGLWAQIGEAAGLPCDDNARNQWLANQAALRAARFAKK